MASKEETKDEGNNEVETHEEEKSTLKTSKEKHEELQRVMTGDLPDDFLKVTEPKGHVNAVELPSEPKSESESKETLSSKDTSSKEALTTEEQDRMLAMALQQQLNMQQEGGALAAATNTTIALAPDNMLGRLTVTIIEARLAKNYGIARMDPYCRVRVGHSVYETPTCANGAREPKWNKTFHCYLLQGVNHFDIEIYDECTFQQDALIAYGQYTLPEAVVKRHEVVDEWVALSGNEGPGKEGMLHIIVSLQAIKPGQPLRHHQPAQVVPNVAAGHSPLTVESRPAPEAEERPRLSEAEMDEFLKMFPNLDKEIILSVHASCRGNKEDMVNQLLQLGQQ